MLAVTRNSHDKASPPRPRERLRYRVPTLRVPVHGFHPTAFPPPLCPPNPTSTRILLKSISSQNYRLSSTRVDLKLACYLGGSIELSISVPESREARRKRLTFNPSGNTIRMKNTITITMTGEAY